IQDVGIEGRWMTMQRSPLLVTEPSTNRSPRPPRPTNSYRPRTATEPHGLSLSEVRLLSESLQWMRGKSAIHVTVMPPPIMNTRERQDEFRRVRSDIAMYQRRAGGPVWQLSVREVSTDKGPQLHMHVVVGGFRNAESAQKVIRHLHATAFKSDVLSRIVDD